VNNQQKFFLIAGERSGDLHSSNLIRSMLKLSNVQVVGWFGELSEQAGGKLLKHYKDIAFMGFWEVLTNLRKTKRYLSECQKQILESGAQSVILVDYGGFNLRIAEFCKKNAIKVHYYISPKVWAWNVKRAYKLKRVVDHLYCILPFEPQFFEQFDFKTSYVGNPVNDAVTSFLIQNSVKNHRKIIAILPGSRKQEVTQMLQVMSEVASEFKDYTFKIAGVDNLDRSLYDIAEKQNIEVVFGNTYDLLLEAEAAIVTSGTATLETALFNVPQVVCYKTGGLNYWIGKKLIKVNFISLVNLIANRQVVKELIQSDFNVHRIKDELKDILIGGSKRNEMLQGYEEIKSILTDKNASDITAKLILERS